MTAALSDQLRLTGDQLRVVATRIGADGLSAGLARPRYTTIDRREAALERAGRELLSRNLILGDGLIHPDLVPVLLTLQRPERELAMRLVSPAGIARISVVRRQTLCMSVCRIGDDVTLRIIGHGVELPDAIAALLDELPSARPADIQAVAAPLQQMAQSLSGTHEAVELADRIRALGTDRHAAMMLGSALASRQAFAEIVYSALAHAKGRICRGPAAVAVFFTKRGRVVGAPSTSPTGELWTTLRPGSNRAVGQAISGLIELGNHSWDAV